MVLLIFNDQWWTICGDRSTWFESLKSFTKVFDNSVSFRDFPNVPPIVSQFNGFESCPKCGDDSTQIAYGECANWCRGCRAAWR